jgi:hypothetical protein
MLVACCSCSGISLTTAANLTTQLLLPLLLLLLLLLLPGLHVLRTQRHQPQSSGQH